jgi:peroxiredoxin
MSDEGSIPQTFILDRQGKIVKRFIGYDESLNEELESAILTVLGDSK